MKSWAIAGHWRTPVGRVRAAVCCLAACALVAVGTVAAPAARATTGAGTTTALSQDTSTGTTTELSQDTSSGTTTTPSQDAAAGTIDPDTTIATSFEVQNQEVTLGFPAGSVWQSFQVEFSTETIPGSSQTKLRFKSVEVYLDKGRPHVAKVRRHGKLVRTTVYEPNATLKDSAGTINVSLAGAAAGAHSCTVQINYERTVRFLGKRVLEPFASTITQELTVEA